MTYFTKKNILSYSKIFTIVNVGSYKVKSVVCSVWNGSIQVLGYGEKRQSRLDVCNGEITNLAGVTATIAQAINTSETNAGVQSEKIIVNAFFCESFLSANTLNYKHSDNNTALSGECVQGIISSVETNSLSYTTRSIESKSGIKKSDLEIIFSNINSIQLDGSYVTDLVGKTGEDISISLLNCFISKENYQIISDICHGVGKTLYKIIPEEYSLIQVTPEKSESICISIGNNSTIITVVGENGFKGSSSIAVGMHDLLKDINKSQLKHRSEIIKKLNREDLFKTEKKKFLGFFIPLLGVGIKEIIGSGICPETFILTGGGANNQFIKEDISKTDFNQFGIKMIKAPNCITPSIHRLREIPGVESILSLSNISLISQILTAKRLFESEHDLISQALKESMNNFMQS